MNVFRDQISHADYHYSLPPAADRRGVSELDYELVREDRMAGIARTNLGRHYPENGRHDELAERLSGLLNTEQSRRNAHYYRYRAMLRIATDVSLFTEQPDNVAEASLSDFHKRVSALDDEGFQFASILGGKGISAELAHVDQLGDWQSGKILDEAIRQLPSSPRLADEGFLFGDTFDSKDNARLDYKFQITDTSRRGRGMNIKGVRKRAAADVLTEDGSIFEIVKQSTFLIDVEDLTGAQLASMGRTLKAQSEYNAAKDERAAKEVISAAGIRLDKASTEAGERIIEPFVSDPENRQVSTAVLAATSLYFALLRHR